MKDIEVVEIDNTTYAVLKEVTHKNTSYIYLSNINDEDDMLIRKVANDMLVPLENEEEFEIACNLLVKEGLI